MSVLRGIASTVMACYVVLGVILAGIFVMVIAVTCAVNSNATELDPAGMAESADATEIWTEDSVRPACAPVPWSDRYPCERLPIRVEGSYLGAMGHMFWKPELPLDPESLYRTAWGRQGIETPQIVVRAVGVPNSSRCSEVGAFNYGGIDYSVAPPDSELTNDVCHVDFDVSEYIIGTGACRIPVIVDWRALVDRTSGVYGTPSYLAKLVAPIAAVYEGNELILELVQPPDLAWGNWSNSHVWDVVRKSDGTIVGRSGMWPLLAGGSEVEDWEFPLDELQKKLKAAHLKVAAEHGGRISADPNSPMLVNDASTESLLAQLREVGAYDAPRITPIVVPPLPRRVGLDLWNRTRCLSAMDG